MMSICADEAMPLHRLNFPFADRTLEKIPMLFQIKTARFNFFHKYYPFSASPVHAV